MDMLVTCMFLLEIFILMLCVVSLSTGLTCDRTKQYPVRNDTSMAIVGCLNCRECLPGYEPKVPCGKIIGIYERVGGCRPCPDGMYSPNRDAKACKICRKMKCFEHQQIEGKCESDKHDLSYCLNKCEKGYKMNKRKTACHLMNMTTIATVGSNIPKVTPTMTSRNTTKKLVVSQNQANEKSSGLNPGVIFVIGVVVVGIALAALYCFCCRNRKRANTGGTKDDESAASTDVLMDRSLEKTGESAIGHLLPVSPLVEKPEEGTVEQANGLMSPVHPCPKPMAEFGDAMSLDTSYPNPSVSDISNDGNITRNAPHSRNDQVAFTTPVHSPLPAGYGNSREQFMPTIIPNPYPYSSVVSRNSNQNHQDRLEGNIPYKIILRIRSHFDVGERWQDLAGWLDLCCPQVNNIKANQSESKTEQIIQIWTTKKENDLPKFLQILNDKGMTQLVVEIEKIQAVCRK